MAVYRLKMSDEVANLIRTLHPDIKRKIKASLQAVLNNPLSGKALKNELEGLRSFRVGRLRVVYKILKGKEYVEVVAVGPRKTIYEETFRLLKRK